MILPNRNMSSCEMMINPSLCVVYIAVRLRVWSSLYHTHGGLISTHGMINKLFSVFSSKCSLFLLINQFYPVVYNAETILILGLKQNRKNRTKRCITSLLLSLEWWGLLLLLFRCIEHSPKLMVMEVPFNAKRYVWFSHNCEANLRPWVWDRSKNWWNQQLDILSYTFFKVSDESNTDLTKIWLEINKAMWNTKKKNTRTSCFY